MSLRIFYSTGILAQYWNDAARTYTAYTPEGVQSTTRPYTAEENQRADAEIAGDTADANQRTIEAALALSLSDLDTIVNTPSFTVTTLTTAVKTIARIVRRIIRLLIRRLDGTT